ncbi:MAG: hypothetical protein AAB444_01615 [Patescibacteria group bacterium]
MLRRVFLASFLSLLFLTATARQLQAASCLCRTLPTTNSARDGCKVVTTTDCEALNVQPISQFDIGTTTCEYFPDVDNCTATKSGSELLFGTDDSLYTLPIEPKLQIPIPNLKFTPALIEESEGKRFYVINTLADYLGGAYTFLLSIAGILAGIMITIGGFEWLIAAGDKGKITHAKERIQNAVIGMVLALGSYVLLSAINPDLVRFKALKIEAIPREYASDTIAGGAEGKPVTIPSTFKEITEPAYIVTNITDGTAAAMESVAADDFLKAARVFSEDPDVSGRKIRITSAFRTYEKQCNLYKRNCGVADCSKKTTSKCKVPTCFPGSDPAKTYCPHTSGIGVDLWCDGDGTKKCAKGGSLGTLDEEKCPCQKILTDIMKRNKFCRLKSEIWHFEHEPAMSGGCQ